MAIYKVLFENTYMILALLTMDLFFGVMDWGDQKDSPPKICLIYPTMMTLGTVMHYPKKIQKVYKSRDTPHALPKEDPKSI